MGGVNSGLKDDSFFIYDSQFKIDKQNIIYNARREKSVIEITKTRFSY